MKFFFELQSQSNSSRYDHGSELPIYDSKEGKKRGEKSIPFLFAFLIISATTDGTRGRRGSRFCDCFTPFFTV